MYHVMPSKSRSPASEWTLTAFVKGCSPDALGTPSVPVTYPAFLNRSERRTVPSPHATSRGLSSHCQVRRIWSGVFRHSSGTVKACARVATDWIFCQVPSTFLSITYPQQRSVRSVTSGLTNSGAATVSPARPIVENVPDAAR